MTAERYFSTTVRVRYIETDQMGIAHHSSVLTWMEAARIELCDAVGLPYKALEASGYRLPVLGVGVHYYKPAYFDDRLTLTVSIKPIASVKFTLSYRVSRGVDVIARATSTHAFVDVEGRVLRPPAHFWEAINLLPANLPKGSL